MHCVSLGILVSIFVAASGIRDHTIWPESKRGYDIIFLLEELQPRPFDAMIAAVEVVVQNVSMPENVNFGAVIYGQSTRSIPFSSNKMDFIDKVSKLKIGTSTGRQLDLGLQRAMEMMQRDTREGVDKVVICMLTEQSANPVQSRLWAHNMRVAYIQIAALSIGSNDELKMEMEEITSENPRMVNMNNDIADFKNNFADQIGFILQLTGICTSSRFDNSIHYVPDSANCNAYFQCNGVDRYIRKYCPLDQFWDLEKVQCRPSSVVQCKDDPCKYHANLQHYGDVLNRNCQYFWTCGLSDKTEGYGCCDGNETYRLNGTFVHAAPPYPKGSCVQLATACNDTCPFVNPHVTPTFKSIPAVCVPDIYLDFNRTVQGTGPNRASILNRGVEVHSPINEAVDNSAGFFDSYSDLLAPRFSHAWYGRYVDMFIRFMPFSDPWPQWINTPQFLVSNGDSGEHHSIFVGYDMNRSQIIVKFNTSGYDAAPPYYAEAVVSNIDVATSYWIDVHVLYDGVAGKLTVDVTEYPLGAGQPGGPSPVKAPQVVRNLTGAVTQVLPALHLGGYTDASTNIYDNLYGWIDTFWIYTCRPDSYWPN